MDMTLSAKAMGHGGGITPFFTINNLFDKKPPLIPALANPGVDYPTTLALYDVVGRAFTAGVRFKF
jgi:iron complex outermembrane receptor protein